MALNSSMSTATTALDRRLRRMTCSLSCVRAAAPRIPPDASGRGGTAAPLIELKRAKCIDRWSVATSESASLATQLPRSAEGPRLCYMLFSLPLCES